jgi:hypothetical protein
MVLARMADSIDASTLPDGLPAYAGYVDGRWPSFSAICKRFYPRAHCVSITTQHGDARFIDCEPGDASIAEACYWLRDRVPVASGGMWTVESQVGLGIAPQWRPGIYFRVSDQAAVLAELRRVMPHLERSAICLWGAHWTGRIPSVLPASLDALQCIGGERAPYDVSALGPRFLRS